MIETNKKKKGSISEEDISYVLRRYTAPTILALLREVSQFPEWKIDWNTLVKKTSTGISNAREYQMLWRHLAYRDALLEQVEDGAEPLDDDSDLEYELEAFPSVSGESSMEAAACVKVMLASGLPSGSGPRNRSTVEAPLTINIPNGQSSQAPSENPQLACIQGTNITVPVSVQNTMTAAEGLDGNGSASGGLPARRKRKLWTAEEDMELIAAVQKCGERNWANILKGDFKGDRTASQLSQLRVPPFLRIIGEVSITLDSLEENGVTVRWAIIRKRQANLNPGGAGNSTGSQLSEAQLAARRAVSLALNMPMMDRLSAACSVGVTHSSTPSSSSAVPAEASPVSGTPLGASTKPVVGSSISQEPHQTQQAPQQTAASSQRGTSSTTPKSRVTTKKTSSVPVKLSVGPNPMIQAAAVAAGARIAPPSTAASLLKAAQSKNAVHIRPGGGSVIKTSMPGGTKSLASNNSGSRPNVHYIRTGLVSASPPPPTYSGVTPSIQRTGSSQQTYGNSARPAAAADQLPSVGTTTSLNFSEQAMSASSLCATSCGTAEGKNTNAISTVAVGLSSKEEVKSSEEMKVDDSGSVPKERGQDDQAALQNSEVVSENLTTMVENLRHSRDVEAGENNQTSSVKNETVESQNASEKMVCSPLTEDEDQSIVNKTGENQSVIDK